MNQIRQLLDRVQAQTVSLERARELYQDRLAPDFNMFAFIDTGEVNLSRVIAWLLDPSATHGQGHKFLVDFLATIGLDWDAGTVGKGGVRCEESTALRRRIDIIVKSGGWTLGIENKLRGAGDGQDQVSDYLAHLDSLSAQGSRCLVYLTVGGSLPTEHSIRNHESGSRIAAQQMKPLGVDGMIEWLQRCRISCRASRVAGFIEDFESFLTRDIKGIRDMTEHDQLLDLVMQSRGSIESAIKIIMAGKSIKEYSFSILADQIKQKIMNDIIFDNKIKWGGKGEKYTYIRIFFPDIAEFHFSVEFLEKDYNYFIYGIRNQMPNADTAGITTILNERFDQGKTSKWWSWYRVASPHDPHLSVNRDWGDYTQDGTPWGEIADGSMAEKIIRAARKIHAALSEHGMIVAQTGSEHREQYPNELGSGLVD